MKKNTPRVFLLIAMVFLMASCAYQHERIEIGYTPIPNTKPILKEECRNVDFVIHDARKHKNMLSRKIGSHGEDAAEIKLSGSLQETVAAAMRSELLARGFQVEPGDKEIRVEIQKFYNVFKQGPLRISAVGECVIDVEVVKKDGTVVYNKTITGKASDDTLWTFAGYNAKTSLENALQDAMLQLFEDYTFLKVLISKKQISNSQESS